MSTTTTYGGLSGIFVISRDGVEIWERREDGQYNVYAMTHEPEKKQWVINADENLKPDRIAPADALEWDVEIPMTPLWKE